MKKIKITLSLKLILLYVILILIPMFIMLFFWFNQYIDNLNGKKQEYLDKVFEYSYDEFSNIFLDIIDVSNRITINPTVKEIIQKSNENRDWEFMQEIQNIDYLFLRTVSSYESIEKYYTLIGSNGRSFGNWGTLPNIEELDEKWIEIAEDEAPFPVWIPLHDSYLKSDDKMISMVRAIEDKGYLRISVNNNDIKEHMNDFEYDSICIINEDRMMLFESNIADYMDIINSKKNIYTNWNNKDTKKLNSNGVLLMTKSLPIQGWTLITIIDEVTFNNDIRQYRRQFVNSTIITMIIFICMILLISYKTISPLNKLKEAMYRVSDGDLKQEIEVKSSDEIGEITMHFNTMMMRINELVSDLKEEEKEKTRIYYESLLAQINPHFLYNTINSIKWSASLSNATNVCEQLTSLGILLEMSTSRVPDMVKLEDELNYIENYMNLQYLRFGEKVVLKVNVDEKLKKLFVPKFILQPFVENSIIHGFGQHEIRGKILIEANEDNNDLSIFIKDNGKGMERDIHDVSLEGSRKKTMNGIGISSIHKRIQLLYGEKYGIRIFNNTKKGTTVHILLPSIYSIGGNTDV